MVNDDVTGAKAGFEIRTFSKPVPRDEEGEFVFVSQAQCNLEELLSVLVQAILVGVEMGRMKAHGIRAGMGHKKRK